MNLNYFKTFFYTAKLGSITNAAEALDITQPAASRQIQELQNSYSLMMFEKVGKKMVLTDAGKILYSIAEKLIDIEEEAERAIKDYKSQKSGKIRITATESFGNYYLPEMIFLFNRMFPEIQISISFADPEEIHKNIVTMKSDIGFTSRLLESSEIHSRTIIEDKYILAVPPGSELSDLIYFQPDDIKNKKFITRQRETEDRKQFESYLSENNIEANIVCEVSSYYSVKEFVKKGIGIAIVPKNAVNDDIEEGSLIAIPEKDNALIREYFMINHQDKYFNKGLHVFREIALKWADFYSKGLLDNSKWDNFNI